MVTLLESSGIKPHVKDHNTNKMIVEEVQNTSTSYSLRWQPTKNL
jgi:hypothetical protein